jgi:RNA polymerase sigma-54 factor
VQRDPNDDDMDSGETQAAATSLREHLGAQVGLTQMPDRERALVAFLIEALDDDGYLTQPLDELVDLLVGPEDDPDLREILLEELGIALRHLQNLDPPGIGARGAQECLTLQLLCLDDSARHASWRWPSSGTTSTSSRRVTSSASARRWAAMTTNCARRKPDPLPEPRPGAQYAPIDTRYVVPDVTVRKTQGQWVVSLNREAMPRLRINRLYADILQRHRSGNGSSAGLAGQLQEAKWLIKNVQQRFDTILRVSQAIVDRQRAFFDHGEVAMRPLTLREIAETVSLHESTISRVTTQKYLASPRGIFELKYFFGSHVATDTGGAASSTAIRALIKQLVGAENGKKPLSDSRLAEILGEQGIVVARRTVAKYRELLGIPPVNLRKAL